MAEKYHWKSQSSQTLGKRINSLSRWKLVFWRWHSSQEVGQPLLGGLLDAKGMWVWSCNVDPEGQGCPIGSAAHFGLRTPRCRLHQGTRKGKRKRNISRYLGDDCPWVICPHITNIILGVLRSTFFGKNPVKLCRGIRTSLLG